MDAIVDASPGGSAVDPMVKTAMTHFKSGKEDPVVAFVSKMVSVRESDLPQNKRQAGGSMTAEEARELARKKRAEIAKAQQDADGVSNALAATSLDDDAEVNEEQPEKDDPEHLIGFARLYSGTLNVGDEVYVLPPKWNPANPSIGRAAPKKVALTALYLLMGRSLEALQSVPAGVVFGIGGLEGAILKSGTLCSQLDGAVNLAGVNMGGSPIVRVALEPAWPGDLDKMIKGLKMLVQADACAEYEVLENGEHVILTAGELHLERCLKDLRERFAKCEIQAGEPIVPYRESIVNAPATADVGLDGEPRTRDKELSRGTVIGVTTSKQVTVRLRVRPLPTAATELLEKHAGVIRRLYAERRAQEGHLEENGQTLAGVDEEPTDVDDDDDDADVMDDGRRMTLQEFKSKLREALAEAKGEKEVWKDCIESIAAFGPRRAGPNILVDKTSSGTIGRV